MAFVNYVNKEINAKIVYYGPGLSGKTTNLVYVHKKLNPNSRGKLISLATETDRTLFFDFLPINLGEISGFKVRFHLYTVPGQIFYNTTRKMVLKGVDGIVFIADSQRQMLEENLESLKNLEENLKDYGKSLKELPFVIQYNKRDLPDAMDLEELHRHLNKLNAPFFPAIATEGKGVLETLTAICKMVINKIRESTEFGGKGEEEDGVKTKEKKSEGVEKPLFLPEEYTDEAMKMLDLLGEGEVGEEEKVEEELIEDELKLFDESSKEEGEVSLLELNKALFQTKALEQTKAIAYEEQQAYEVKLHVQGPIHAEDREVVIPLTLSYNGKEKKFKLTLKIEESED